MENQKNYLFVNIKINLFFILIFGLFLSLLMPKYGYSQKSAITYDSLVVRQLLDSAQILSDYSEVTDALKKALEAEAIEEQYMAATDPKRAETYAAIGSIYAKKRDKTALIYRSRLQQIPVSQLSLLTKAHVLNFEALYKMFLVTIDTFEKFQDAINTGQAAIAAYRAASLADGTVHPNMIRAYSNIGLFNYTYGFYQQGLLYYDSAVTEGKRKFKDLNHPLVAHPLGNKGLLYKDQGRLKDAQIWTEKALSIRENTLPSTHRERGASLNNLGLVYADQGDVSMAEVCFEEALYIARIRKDTQLMAASWGNLGMVADRISEYQRANDYYKSVIQLGEKDDNEKAVTYMNVGLVYQRLFESKNPKKMAYIDTASIYFDTASNLMQPSYHLYSQLLNGKALVETARKHSKQADSLLQKTKQLEIQKGNIEGQVQAFFNLSRLWLQQKNYSKAFSYCDSALVILGYSKDANLSSIVLYPSLLFILVQRNQVYWTQHKDTQYKAILLQLLSYLEEVDAVFKQARLLYDDHGNWFNLKKSIYQNTEIATEVNLRLRQLTGDKKYNIKLFDLAEKTRSQLLLYRLNQNKAKEQSDTAARWGALRDRLDICHAMIVFYTQQQALGDMSVSAALADSLIVRRDLFRQLETTGYQSNKDLKIASVTHVQKALNTNQTLVAYLMGEKHFVIMVINKDQPIHIQPILRDNLDALVDKMTKDGIWIMEDRNTQDLSRKNYTDAAKVLYDSLVKPVKSHLKEEVIIIPDGKLGFVPFGALLTETPNRFTEYTNYKFLINEHIISYGFSATTQILMQKYEYPKGDTVWIFAPFTQTNTCYMAPEAHIKFVKPTPIDSLPETLITAQKIDSLRTCKIDTGSMTQTMIVRSAERYPILHFMTHGYGDQQKGANSWLAYRKDNLWLKWYAKDIARINLHADLVILEGCELHIGSEERFEGLVNVSCSFAQAGACSVVSTLWSISPKHSQTVMVNFHENLIQGKSKSKALTLAQRAYIKQAPYPKPSRWAAYVLYGAVK
jgi:CHAT domain-containing protein/tetratricopeptide (TPR) repeat protein